MKSYQALLKSAKAVKMLVNSSYYRQPNLGLYRNQIYVFPGMQANSFTSVAAQLEDPSRHNDYNQLVSKQKNESAVVIDVREPEELVATGTIPGSINIPLGQVTKALELAPEEFRAKYGADKPSKDDLVIFSCRSGKRSLDALSKALQLDYKKAENYKGGWLDWERNTKPGL